jgi:hypothetical protein
MIEFKKLATGFFGFIGFVLMFVGKIVDIYRPVLHVWGIDENLGSNIFWSGLWILLIVIAIVFYLKHREESD